MNSSGVAARLLVWRHGQTVWNATDRFQGHVDVDLDEVGLAQAEEAAALLADQGPDLIVTSDLRRAARTAEALAARTGLPVTTEPRLRERGYGDWEGLTGTEVAERYPEERRRWRAGQEVDGCRVESLADLTKRVGEGVRAAVERAPGGTVVVVTHGAAAKRVCAALLNWSDEVIHGVAALANCHWAELRSGASGWRLSGYNVGPHR